MIPRPSTPLRLLPVSEVAFLLATTPHTIRRLIKRGDLPATRLGSGRTSWRIPEEAVLQFALKFGDLDPNDLVRTLVLDNQQLPVTTTDAGSTPVGREL